MRDDIGTLKKVAGYALMTLPVILLIWILLGLYNSRTRSNRKEIENKLDSVCGVISGNIDLRDKCLERGYEEFLSPNDTSDRPSYYD